MLCQAQTDMANCVLSKDALSIIAKIKEVEHSSIKEMELQIQELEELKEPCTKIFVSFYKLKKYNYTHSGELVIEALDEFAENNNLDDFFELKMDLDMMRLSNYYQYSEFEKSSLLLKEVSTYILDTDYDIERLVFLHGLTSEKTFILDEGPVTELENAKQKLELENRPWFLAKINFALASTFINLQKKEEGIQLYSNNYKMCLKENLIDEAIINLNALAYLKLTEREGVSPESLSLVEKAIELAITSGHTKILNELLRLRGHIAWNTETLLNPYEYYKQAYKQDSINGSRKEKLVNLAYLGFAANKYLENNGFEIGDSLLDLGLSQVKESDLIPKRLLLERKIFIRKWLGDDIPDLKKQVDIIKDEIENNAKRLNNLKQIAIVNFKAKEQKIKVQEVESQLDKEVLFRQKLILGFVLFLFPLLLAFLYYYRRKYSYLKQIDDKNYIIKDQNETLKSLVKDLEANNQALENFAHVAAHDIKAPLNTISSFAGLIKSKYQDKFNEEEANYLDIILSSSSNLQQIVNDLLKFSSLTQHLPDPKPIDINEIMKVVQNNLYFNLENKQADFIQTKKMPLVRGHKSLITQLFQNIISNSLKHSKPNEINKIKIDWEDKNNQFMQFTIEDNGIGIPAENLKAVFDLFKTFNVPETGVSTGIGLATCKKIVEFYKGEIWISSEPEIGTKVFFTLPKN